MAEPAPQERPDIPDKLYFRIGEVAKLAGVKPYVLRYWETEFSILDPKKSGSNHRLYRRKDVESILEIKRLLYEKRFTIEGARKFLSGGKAPEATRTKPKPAPVVQTALFGTANSSELREIRVELQALLDLLN
ncbi:MAG: MerR family transcriptional regulator [Bryobacteraceae bacterium]|nr:MerR family transcriptional regulator [Bryobacteraceae bacterium]